MYVTWQLRADGRKRVEGQLKENEEKVGKKRNEVSLIVRYSLIVGGDATARVAGITNPFSSIMNTVQHA